MVWLELHPPYNHDPTPHDLLTRRPWLTPAHTDTHFNPDISVTLQSGSITQGECSVWLYDGGGVGVLAV